MDILLMIVYVSIALGFLVLIHEGGHYLAARAFKVRVTEFMIGFPGPGIKVKHGETRFGITCVPLGGYARICGMEAGEMSPYLKEVLAAIYRRGTAYMEDIAQDCGITNDEAYDALSELVEWGSITGPTKKDQYNIFRTAEVRPTRRQIAKARKAGLPEPVAYDEGTPRELEDAAAFYESEYQQTYRSKPFWKRCIILLAGIATNLLFAILAVVIIYSFIGFDITYASGEVVHATAPVWRSIYAGVMYIGMVAQAILSLFNPATAAQTVSDSTSIVGIAVYSKAAADAGLVSFFEFVAMISVSLGLMNLLPIPPLDGGRFIIEIIQKITGRPASVKVVNAVTMAGMALFLVFFAFMLNQDLARFVFGSWGS